MTSNNSSSERYAPRTKWTAEGFEGDTDVINVSPEVKGDRAPAPVRRELGHVASYDLEPGLQKQADLDDFFNTRKKPTEILPPAMSYPPLQEANRNMYHAPSRNGVRPQKTGPSAAVNIARMHDRNRGER